MKVSKARLIEALVRSGSVLFNPHYLFGLKVDWLVQAVKRDPRIVTRWDVELFVETHSEAIEAYWKQ